MAKTKGMGGEPTLSRTRRWAILAFSLMTLAWTALFIAPRSIEASYSREVLDNLERVERQGYAPKLAGPPITPEVEACRDRLQAVQGLHVYSSDPYDPRLLAFIEMVERCAHLPQRLRHGQFRYGEEESIPSRALVASARLAIEGGDFDLAADRLETYALWHESIPNDRWPTILMRQESRELALGSIALVAAQGPDYRQRMRDAVAPWTPDDLKTAIARGMNEDLSKFVQDRSDADRKTGFRRQTIAASHTPLGARAEALWMSLRHHRARVLRDRSHAAAEAILAWDDDIALQKIVDEANQIYADYNWWEKSYFIPMHDMAQAKADAEASWQKVIDLRERLSRP